MNLQQLVYRSSMPSVAAIPAAQPQALGSAAADHQPKPTMEQRAEWALGMSLQTWRMLPREAQMPDFVLRLTFAKALSDAPIDIRVMLFAHTCKLATTFTDADFLCAWRMLVDAYRQESPEVRELLKTDMDRVHTKTGLYGHGEVQWDRSPKAWQN